MKLKKFAAVLVAAVMALSVAGSVFAADYPSDDEGNVVGTPTIGDGTSASSPTSVVTTSSVSGSSATKNIYITENASVSVNAIKKLSGTVNFRAPGYTMTIKAQDIVTPTNINLGASNHNKFGQTVFEKWFSEPVATVGLTQQGEFGGKVSLTITPQNIDSLDLTKTIYAFSYNPKTNSYKRMGAVSVKGKEITVELTRGYVIVLSNSSTFTAK